MKSKPATDVEPIQLLIRCALASESEALSRMGAAAQECLDRLAKSRRNAIATAHRLRAARDKNTFLGLERAYREDFNPLDDP